MRAVGKIAAEKEEKVLAKSPPAPPSIPLGSPGEAASTERCDISSSRESSRGSSRDNGIPLPPGPPLHPPSPDKEGKNPSDGRLDVASPPPPPPSVLPPGEKRPLSKEEEDLQGIIDAISFEGQENAFFGETE